MTEPERLDWTGRELRLEIGPVAHGGHCVARHEGRVVFVRHCLPGEIVRAVVTEDGGGGFCRADALEALVPSPDRVPPACPYAGPGRCGGCDWQHASGDAQRRLKEAVVAESLIRFGAVAPEQAAVPVEGLSAGALPAGALAAPREQSLLGWRTRTVYACAPSGELGLHRHRSSSIEPVRSCPISVESVGGPEAVSRGARVAASVQRRGVTGVEIVSPGAVLLHTAAPAARRSGRGRRPPDSVRVAEGPARIEHVVRGRSFAVRAEGFWQVHPAAAETFADVVLSMAAPQPGETALDLYAGAGLFTAFLGQAVGPGGRVLGLESSRGAVADAESNLADLPQAQVLHGVVDAGAIARLSADLGAPPSVVVLDPPRAGAGRAIIDAVLSAARRAVVYVACDPVAFGRDVRVAGERGWRLGAVRAFDAFPMTHHVECIGLLLPPSGASPGSAP